MTKQTISQQYVGNDTSLPKQKTLGKQGKLSFRPNAQFDPYLICAIIRRKPSNITSILKLNNGFHRAEENLTMLHESQYDALRHYYGEALLTNPIKLALKICNSETPETTHNNDPTRFDVLHTLAGCFDELVAVAQLNKYPTPNLGDILKFAKNLKNSLPLDIFILGLSDENKQIAGIILKKLSDTISYM